jgi:hypothetical protein
MDFAALMRQMGGGGGEDGPGAKDVPIPDTCVLRRNRARRGVAGSGGRCSPRTLLFSHAAAQGGNDLHLVAGAAEDAQARCGARH